MINEPLDPRIDRLIAFLYGELPEDEEKKLREQLKLDAELLSEWEELVASRRLLREAEGLESKPPHFVLVGSKAQEQEVTRVAVPIPWREKLGRLLAGPAWAFSAAVVLAVVLAIAGLRVERLDSGFAFRFGEAPVVDQELAEREPAVDSPSSPGGSEPVIGPATDSVRVPSEPSTSSPTQSQATSPQAKSPQAKSPQAESPQAESPRATAALSREDLDRYQVSVTQAMEVMLQEYGRRHDQAVASAVQTFFEGLRNEQRSDYQELRGRIEDLQVGFLAENARTQTHVEYLERQQRAALTPPAGQGTKSGTEVEKND